MAVDVRRSTFHDPILVQTSWSHVELTVELSHFYRRRELHFIVQGYLMISHRMAVHRALRPRLLWQFHTGNPGVNRVRTIVRSYAK